MNVMYLQTSKENDIQVRWSDSDTFNILVSVNRLPDIEADMSTGESMAHYFEQLRENMKPIGLGMDGYKGNFTRLDELYEKIEDIKKAGYKVDKDYKSIIESAHSKNDEIANAEAKKAKQKAYSDNAKEVKKRRLARELADEEAQKIDNNVVKSQKKKVR